MTASEPSAPTARLAASDLGFRYGRRAAPALAGIDLALDGPGIWGLVGPNGAGKSTLIKTWAGLERPTSGSVRVMGLDPITQRRAAASALAYVPQTPAVYRSLSVADHLDLARTERPGFDASRAERYLEGLRIPRGAKGSQLSGGQRAQLGLAIALGTQAPILLLDEPLASLDPLARRDFLGIVEDAAMESGATVVLSSHTIGDIEDACDRLLVLGEGSLLLQGPISTLLAEHWVLGDGRPPPISGLLVASFAGRDRQTRQLWRAAQAPAGATPARVEDVVVAYLTLGRGQAHVD